MITRASNGAIQGGLKFPHDPADINLYANCPVAVTVTRRLHRPRLGKVAPFNPDAFNCPLNRNSHVPLLQQLQTHIRREDPTRLIRPL
jgi:hypothetical protein